VSLLAYAVVGALASPPGAGEPMVRSAASKCVQLDQAQRVEDGYRAELEGLVERILHRRAMRGGVVVVPCNKVAKVVAWDTATALEGIPKGEYIVYQPDWVREVLGNDRDQLLVVLGHEVGHLVNREGRADGTSQEFELDADRFAGCTAAEFEVSWDKVEDVLSRLRDSEVDEGDAHPDRNRTLAAAQDGYARCEQEQRVERAMLGGAGVLIVLLGAFAAWSLSRSRRGGTRVGGNMVTISGEVRGSTVVGGDYNRSSGAPVAGAGEPAGSVAGWIAAGLAGLLLVAVVWWVVSGA